jgi:Flp pilus assembly protein TadB
MILVVIAGSSFGSGVFLLAFPEVLGRLTTKVSNWLPTMQNQMRQRTSERHRSDLALTERIAEDMVVQKLVGVVAGAALPAVLFSSLSVLGVASDNSFALCCSVVCAFLGFSLPDQRLKVEARRRRQSFLHAFSSFLDLTNVLLAGGAGTETALMAAADAGDGWAFGQLRNALVRARSARTSPWNELAALGERFNLTHVTEVAGSIQLAGEHGARIRSSLSAKAESLRHRQMSEIEAAANSATERMGVPMVLLFLAFIMLIGYPAVTLVLGGL